MHSVNHLPPSDPLTSMTFELTDAQYDLVLDIMQHVNSKIEQTETFVYSSNDNKAHIKFIALSAAKWYVKEYSHPRIVGTMVIPMPIPNEYDTETHSIVFITRRKEAIVHLISAHILMNLDTYGIFTEYWNLFEFPEAVLVADPSDVFGYSIDAVSEDYSSALDASFEENRVSTLDKIYEALV